MLDAFHSLPVTQRILEALAQGHPHRAVGGLWGASSATLLAALSRSWPRILVVTADDDESASLEGDVRCFARDAPVRVLVQEEVDVDGEVSGATRSQRLRCLAALREQPRYLLLCSLKALLQRVPSRRSLEQGQTQRRVGQELDHQALYQQALQSLRNVPVILAPGEVSLRGDVLDIYPLAAEEALRLEFFDRELESIRTFDPLTQSSRRTLETATLTLAPQEHTSDVLDHVVAKDLLLVQHEPLRLEERQVQVCSPGDPMSKSLARFREAATGLLTLDLQALPSHDLDYKILSAGSAVGQGELDPAGRLRSIRGLAGSVQIFCRTQKEKERLQEIFAHKHVDLGKEQVALFVGSLSRGFRVPDLKLTCLSNVEFAGVPQRARAREPVALPSRALRSFFELGPGDLVVHAAWGIARFEGIERVTRGDAAEDHLRLIFRDEVVLWVPASKIHLVQKYVGAGDARPKLDKLGGKGFARRKEEVEKALFDMSADLLDLQAERERARRKPYPKDSLEDEFLDGFPFTDTNDQQQAWQEIQADLELPQPMDRLLCGDVGFGKTELAMRAAFKIAITGRQVAVLVPTTVLAEQHARTFGDRFTPHGLVVDVLSRFRSARDRKRVLEDLAVGRIDVLVGTHRLLSDDVAFRDLGLLIVDEEQRFGVRHKEHIKQLRRHVDVLTLTATPIPRTLQSSLLGIRAISTLNQPPLGRQEVSTRMSFHSPQLVQQAIQQELDREGQVFLLHNRVATIDNVARQVQQLVPRAKVAIGHGKMTELKMEKTLRTFLRGDADVLVCTTIIENGLDIPRANTILIERADRFGLAELHQLRGRVGRSTQKAHCYLLLDRDKPPGDEARKRLKALEEFSGLGAGFAIAMKDLEIRGAGNLLGPEQSGHIASVGYEMYCQLLRTAVENARNDTRQPHEVQEVDVDLRLQAFLPDNFVTEPKARLELLREMDSAVSPMAAKTIGVSIQDRFGPMPQPVQNLLLVFLLKHLLLTQDVLGIQLTEPDRLVVRHRPQRPLGGAWL
ncbi:MAG: transcription-repair coupling factor, partial [Planctomycetota bacterium]